MGIEIKRDRPNHQIMMRQKSYIEKACEKFEIEKSSWPTTTPMESGFVAEYDHGVAHLPSHVPYRELLGILLYIARYSRPDIHNLSREQIVYAFQ